MLVINRNSFPLDIFNAEIFAKVSIGDGRLLPFCPDGVLEQKLNSVYAAEIVQHLLGSFITRADIKLEVHISHGVKCQGIMIAGISTDSVILNYGAAILRAVANAGNFNLTKLEDIAFFSGIAFGYGNGFGSNSGQGTVKVIVAGILDDKVFHLFKEVGHVLIVKIDAEIIHILSSPLVDIVSLLAVPLGNYGDGHITDSDGNLNAELAAVAVVCVSIKPNNIFGRLGIVTAVFKFLSILGACVQRGIFSINNGAAFCADQFIVINLRRPADGVCCGFTLGVCLGEAVIYAFGGLKVGSILILTTLGADGKLIQCLLAQALGLDRDLILLKTDDDGLLIHCDLVDVCRVLSVHKDHAVTPVDFSIT